MAICSCIIVWVVDPILVWNRQSFLTIPNSGIVYAIYQLKKSSRPIVDKMLADDIIGRQAVTQKDASSFGMDSDKIVIMYEGSEEGHSRLKELFGDELEALDDSKAEEIYTKIKEEESQAEDGMGFLFG